MADAQATARTAEETNPVATPESVQSAQERCGDPKNFINRELIWLEFNGRNLAAARKTCRLGASLFSTGSLSDADAAGCRCQPSIPASLEPQPQSAHTSKGAPAGRATARDRAGAASRAAAHPFAARHRRERAVGIHLPRIAH